MKAVVTGLPIMMVESSEVVSMAVLKGSSSDSSDVNIRVSWSAGSGCSSICNSSSSGMVSNSAWGWIWQSGRLLWCTLVSCS